MLESHTMPKGTVLRHPMLWLLIVSLSLTLANGAILPSFEAMDERFHFNLIRYLAQGHSWPDQHDIALAVREEYHQQGGQAPLYYWLNAWLLRLLGADVTDWQEDAATLTIGNRLSSYGDVSRSTSKGLYLRQPERERWPYRGAALGLHVLRAANSIWAVVTILGVYHTARSVFPSSVAVAVLAAALVGFNPRFLLHAGTLTNDNLVTALATWGVYLAADTLRRGHTLARTVTLGALAGLAALAKLGGTLLLPLSALTIAEVTRRERRWWRGLGHLTLLAGVWLALAGWWFIGNWVRYGEVALIPFYTAHTPGGLRAGWPPHVVIPEIITVVRTFWTDSGFCNIEVGVFPIYAALCAVGTVGLTSLLRRADRGQRRRCGLLLLWASLTFLSWLRFNSMVWAPDGRYMFQALAAVMPLLAAGLWHLCGLFGRAAARIGWRMLVIGLGILALGAPVGALGPLFAPPRTYPAHRIAVPHPLDVSFDGQVRLLGFDVNGETFRPSQTVDVGLYLTADHPVTESLIVGLQIESLPPDDNTLLVNFRSWPAGGRLPTTAWRPGEVLIDRYRLRLPDDVRVLQVWDLDLLVLHSQVAAGQNERLSATVEGVPAGNAVTLTRLRVLPSVPVAPPLDALLGAPPSFGPHREVTLRAARVWAERRTLRIRLWWWVERPLADDYTVFVHLLDEQGRLMAAGDSVPLHGAMPTYYWRAGDIIADEYDIQLPAERPNGACQIGVGFYRADGRLPAWDAQGLPLPDATAIIMEWR